MIIIWRGYGFLVLVAGILAVLAGSILIGVTKLHQPLIGVVYTATMGLAGLALWLFAHRIESAPGRVFIDKATGREIKVGRSAGSFFFIPTRYWAFLLPALAVAGDIAVTLNPPVH
jgi:hypothetical protein